MAFLLHPCSAALILLLFAAPGVAAQGGAPSFQPETIQAPKSSLTDGPVVVTVEWKYVLPTMGMAPVAYAGGNPKLIWDPPTCDGPGITATGSLEQEVPLQPTASEVEGSSTFEVSLTGDATTGADLVFCTFTGHVSGTASMPPSAPSKATVPIRTGFDGAAAAQDSASGPETEKGGLPTARASGGSTAVMFVTALVALALVPRRQA